jgi:hypothetical protein
MAKTWTNTVPDGRIGTGNAQVFGVNPLAGQFANQLGALREQQQLKAQQVAKDWRDFDIAASEGLLWAPEVSGIEKSILDKGIKLKQAGVDPYGSSEEAMQFRRDLAGVKSLQGYRKSAEEQAKETSKYIRQNLDTLDPEDIQKYHDFYKNTSLQDAYGKNLMPPEIRKRFNDEDVLKSLKARTIKEDITLPTGERAADTVLDVKGTENVVLGAYLGNPRGRDQLLKVTAGLPPRDVQEFAPTYEGNVMQVQSYLEGTPGALEDLAANGILPGTPQMKEYVSDLAAKRASVRKNFDNWLLPKVDRLASGEDVNMVRVAAQPNLGRETLDERIRHNKAMEAKKAASGGAGEGNAASDVRKEWIQDIRNWQPNALEKLVAAGNANQEYDKKDTFKIFQIQERGTNKKQVKLHVPAKIKTVNGVPETISEAHDYTINQNDPNFETYMNQLIGDVTGAKVDIGSVGAKSSNLKKSPPNTPVQTPVKSNVPKVGTVEGGYKFKGGNPADPKNWEKVK